jgi:two-component system, LuxR family, sensor kinase FixL
MNRSSPRRHQPESNPTSLLLLALGLLAGVAWLHWRFPGVPLGVLYVFPMLAAALTLNRWQIVVFALLLASVRSVFIQSGTSGDAALRFLLGLLAYGATGLLVVEMARNRALLLKHNQEISMQQALLLEAQADLRNLAEGSPAAIFTLDDQARILSGNKATRALLGIPMEGLIGFSAKDSLPVLADALKFAPGTSTFRTAAQCQGVRGDGERFVAQSWFSTYDTPTGRRLAAIAVDISDEIREREEQNLRQLLTNNRIVAAAMSHEIRNICGAISLVYSRISQGAQQPVDPDFQAFGSLVGALGRIAALDLQARTRSALETVDLADVLDQLKIIILPDWREAGGALHFSVPRSMPRVFGEGYGILQVLMNLSQNSLRAVESSKDPFLAVSFSATPQSLLLTVTDSGPGVTNATELFEPFRSGTGRSGMGLYVSRAILRSYGGDLKYDAREQGASFVLELAIAAGAAR